MAATYLPQGLVEEIKLYLKSQVERGDLEAQILLAQVEQLEGSTVSALSPGMFAPPEGWELGC
jgi:hypothetical protein